jgi:ArsR family transcriptional regulator
MTGVLPEDAVTLEEQQDALPATNVDRQSCRMALPVFDDNASEAELDAMMDNATIATNFLKAIGHEGRLMILCHLATGEKSVTELEDLLSARQAAVSQQLSRLRLEGLVQPRRDGKTIYYSLTDDRCKRIIGVVYELFCK